MYLAVSRHHLESRIPCARDADPGSEGGRGLVVVAAVADRWGVEEGPSPCKAVWVELDLPGEGREP
ncbi:hypothetical protein [Streptomyces sp. M-16]|uniref:hypothetical protein n=1 Tax=Streptomyces sp. M-16 TaxID=3233040 RepID=UPI003F9B4CDC